MAASDEDYIHGSLSQDERLRHPHTQFEFVPTVSRLCQIDSPIKCQPQDAENLVSGFR